MRLSILNYPKSISPKMKTTVTNEDDALLKLAKERVDEMNYGRGALIISEVLHTDLANLNNRVYKKKGMAESAQSFVSPYPTPFIMHHDMGGGGMFGGGDPKLLANGSNVVAEYFSRRTETANGVASGYVKVGTFIPESAMIGGQRVIDAIQSRQLYALSIGASVQEANHRCSICGNPIYSEECEHRPGKVYEGVLCLAEIYNPLFKEYSAVYNPSDVVAAIRRMDLSEAAKNPLIANECRIIDNGFDVCEVALYDLASKLYPSSGIDSNTTTKEEGHQASMDVKDNKPAEPTTPKTPSTTIDETTKPETQAPATLETSADPCMTKALDIIANHCTKSDEAVAAALGVIKDMAGVIGDLRKEKVEAHEQPAAPEAPSTPEAKTESSAAPETPEAPAKTEEAPAPASTESGETTPETKTEEGAEKPSAPAETQESEKPESETTESASSTDQAPAEEPSQPVSTSEATPKEESAGEDLATVLAKRRASVLAKKRMAPKKFGKRY